MNSDGLHPLGGGVQERKSGDSSLVLSRSRLGNFFKRPEV
jgi:hypothetical protein